MIRYALSCAHGHEFEGWFSASADFDDQKARGLLVCPVCDSPEVGKQIMAPAVAGTKRTATSAEGPNPEAMRAMMMEAAGRIRAHVEANFDDVGDTFAREARAIHEGRSEERGIYGQASAKEVRALVEDGVPVAPLPDAPPGKTQLN